MLSPEQQMKWALMEVRLKYKDIPIPVLDAMVSEWREPERIAEVARKWRMWLRGVIESVV